MPIALKAVEELLLPKFNKEVDYESYYKSYRESGAFDRDKFSNIKYRLALLFEDYEDAHRAREEYYKHFREANMERFGTEHHQNSERQEWFEQLKSEYTRIKQAMENNDRKTIEEYISAFEKTSLDSYVKAFSTPKKYEKYLETGILPFEIVAIQKP
jgi:hypothetical protein